MKKWFVVTLCCFTASCFALASTHASARDDVSDFSLATVLGAEISKQKLGSEIAFYFGDQAHPAVLKDFGVFKTNKKTNAFGKSDLEACNWVFLSAMIALKERAIKEGGNAVVEIKSNYKNNLTSSTQTFQCGAGNVIAGVALTGKVVKLAN